MIISVTEIKTGVSAYNVLPPKATIKGTICAVEKQKLPKELHVPLKRLLRIIWREYQKRIMSTTTGF